MSVFLRFKVCSGLMIWNPFWTNAPPAPSDVPCDIYVCDCNKKKKREALCFGRQHELRHIPRVPGYISYFRLSMASLRQLTRKTLGNLSNFNIQRIDLPNNPITYLSNDAFADFKHLKSLDLSSNPMSAKMLKDAFYGINSSKFHTLRLDSMFLDNFPDDFLDAFRHTAMNVITISDNNLTTFNARVFSPLRSVIRLHLSDNSISSFVLNNTVYVSQSYKAWFQGSVVPKEIFAHAPNLKSIDMTKTKFNLNPDVDLPSMLLPAQSLVSLSMGSCLLGSLPADTLWRMPNLRKLDLIANHLTAFSLGPALRKVTQLDTLILQGNKIMAVNESTPPLEFRQSSRVLDLSKNDFACTCDLLWLKSYICTLRRRQNEDLIDDDDEYEMLYDVYIAYSQFDVDWMLHELAPLLEASPYVQDRDQGAGPLADNIVNHMDQSARVVLVLSDDYTREGWSGYEFNNVIYTANEQHKDVVVILKGDVEAGRLTKDMRRLLTAGTFLH